MSSKIPFSIVIITRNEESKLPRLLKNCKEFLADGGEIIVMDTGSKDDTIKIAKEAGCITYEVGDQFAFYVSKQQATKLTKRFMLDGGTSLFTANQRIFHFGNARQHASTYATNDIIFSIDASDLLLSFDYKTITKKILEENKARFRYRQFYGGSDLEISRIYDRRVDKWSGCIHEILSMNFKKEQEFICNDKILRVKHDNDKVVVRNYASGLAMDNIKFPNDARWYYYLGREFYYNKLHKSAINILEKYAVMKHAWLPERSDAYCLIGKCHEGISDKYEDITKPENAEIRLVERSKAVLSYLKAFELYSDRREPLIALGYLHLKDKHFRKAICYARAAMAIPSGLSSFAENVGNYTHEPHQIIYRSCSWLGMKDEGRVHWKEALRFLPDAKWIKDHASFFE